MMFSRYIQEAETPQEIENINKPISTIEININSLKKSLKEGRTKEAMKIVDNIQTSIGQIKNHIDQLKKA